MGAMQARRDGYERLRYAGAFFEAQAWAIGPRSTSPNQALMTAASSHLAGRAHIPRTRGQMMVMRFSAARAEYHIIMTGFSPRMRCKLQLWETPWFPPWGSLSGLADIVYPICAVICGVWTSQWLRSRLTSSNTPPRVHDATPPPIHLHTQLVGQDSMMYSR
jgi:hypothetical protein